MKIKYYIFILLTFYIIQSDIKAQNQNQNNYISLKDTSKTIILTGESELKFAPDYYEIEIVINDDVCRRGENMETILEKLKSLIKSNNANPDSLKLIKIIKNKDFFSDNKTDNLIEKRFYQIISNNNFLYDIILTESLLNELMECNLKDLKNTQLEKYKEKLYEEAMKDAINKAKIIADFNSQKIETVLEIKESYWSNYEEDINSGMTDRIDENFNYHLKLKLHVIFKVN